MSRRLLLGSSAAALALVVALPSAAMACEKGGEGSGSGGRSDHSKSSDHGKGSDHGKSSDEGDQAKSSDQSKDSDQSKSSDQGNDSGQAKSADQGNGANGGADTAGHNPPGNNGTIKIDYAAPADSGHANRPHPGCAFQLRMFNFDENQYGTITFVGQAPTKLGTLLTQTHMLLSDDAAGGGQDVDAVYGYTAQQLGLIGKPQAKQGWHIKVSVDADNAPGGAKQKVFWLKCAEAPAATTSNGGTTTPVTNTPGTTTPATATNSSTSAGTTTTTSGTSAGAANAAAPAAAAPAAAAATTVTGGEAAAAAAPAAVPAAAPASRGSALPFTGSNIVTMLVVALAALLAGGFAIRAGRRRSSQL